jgi:hypothetical protein
MPPIRRNLSKDGGIGVAALEDDQYDEHHRGAMGFSSYRVPLMRHPV